MFHGHLLSLAPAQLSKSRSPSWVAPSTLPGASFLAGPTTPRLRFLRFPRFLRLFFFSPNGFFAPKSETEKLQKPQFPHFPYVDAALGEVEGNFSRRIERASAEAAHPCTTGARPHGYCATLLTRLTTREFQAL